MRRLTYLVLLLLPPLAWADVSAIQIQHPWSRPMPAGAVGVVYLTATDSGPPDTLLGVSSPVATSSSLHESYSENGVMKMRPVSSLPIAQDTPITLKPESYHIMLVGLKQPLVIGKAFPLTLNFAKAGSVTVDVAVQGRLRAEPMQHTGMDMPGMHMGGGK